jgi:hypothetical protein
MSLEVVKRARAKYDHLEGEERAYHIVNQVAWDLKADGASLPQAGQAGTFYKPSGANYNERSIDVIIYKPGGETYDILADAEGVAKPQWTRTKPSGFGDVSKWRAAVPPLVVGPEPVPEPEPEPEPEPPPTGAYITRAEFEAYQRQVDQEFRGLRTEIHALIGKLNTRVLALETKPPQAYWLVADASAQPIGTSRNSFPAHGHEIRAAVVPKV